MDKLTTKKVNLFQTSDEKTYMLCSGIFLEEENIHLLEWIIELPSSHLFGIYW